MLSPNMPESWIVQAATYLLGGSFTGLQALASVQDHIVVCEDAEAAVLVVSATLEEHGRQVLDQVQFGDVGGEHRGDPVRRAIKYQTGLTTANGGVYGYVGP
ncbi:hypothetical protein ABZT34_37340 [Streptomyces sp. NPDC005329]|uniref:hypothetical protein n=1 Tax=Streptomyces sp. NPDC005329 TaxID=3157034 RepID=UPI0033BBBB85